jgi:hypothetical protein
MNDIYEHKAKKYKYKYLKLKKELEGGKMLDIFRSEKTIKENTIKILEKAINYVQHVIASAFNKNKVIGKYYDFENLPKNLPASESFYYTNKEQIYNYMAKSPISRDKYPTILQYYYHVKYRDTKKFERYHFEAKLDKKDKKEYTELPDSEEKTIYSNMIAPKAKNLDIYLIIMYIKKLFYYIVSSDFDTKTLKLVKGLENDAYINIINSPEALIIKIQEIIKSINDSIPTAPTPTKK